MTRGQKVPAGGGEKMTAGEQPRADMLAGDEGPLPGDVHKRMGAGAAHSDNAGFGKRGREPVAEQRHLIGERHRVDREVVGMDVHIPEAGHQVPAFKINHLRVVDAARFSVWHDRADAAVLDEDGSVRPYLGLDTVDQVRMGKDYLHDGAVARVPGATTASGRAASF